jgi:hypothetical protein
MKSPLSIKSVKKVPTLTAISNRQRLLMDLLPVFCTTLDQIDTLELWREGTYAALQPYPITPSQAWAVVKLVFTSSNYQLNQQQAIYDSQNTLTPGLAAELALNTCLALVADDPTMDIYYTVFTLN